MSILIVDDSQHSRMLLTAFLRAAGYTELPTAGSAHEAFLHLGMDGPDGAAPEVDLILMDITMPEIDGVEACRQIKATPLLQDIPIIVVTAHDEGKYLDEAFAAGAIDYITKPVNKVELLARVRSALTLKQETDARKHAYMELEKLFLHAQKLESIGRLAAGIAHDFNNLLTPIMGYTQLEIMKLPPGNALRSKLEEIQKAAERGATLTRQLLALSHRRANELKVIDLSQLIADVSSMLRRVMGEDVELVVLPGPELWLIKVDPGQMEQVVMNMAVNARDALPNGGKLTVKTANVTIDQDYAWSGVEVPPGEYVMLTVKDTGIGMTEEVKAKIFEPFFTTKEEGKGTGLGLATCYSIVTQSGGHIKVCSELGKGTSFNIYIPRVDGVVSALFNDVEEDYLPKGTETILLAEDEPLVRKLVASMLSDLGYTVLQTNNGEEALRAAQKHTGEKIYLLLTDVVMPQMSGTELAGRLRIMRPDIRVLLTSGYICEDIGQLEDGDPDTPFIQKPFMPAALARKVREVLDQ